MKIVMDEDALRIPSIPVKNLNEGLAIARKLHQTLNEHNKKAVKVYRKDGGKGKELTLGVGLSAPQIGIYKSVFVMLHGGRPYTLINPTLVEHSETKIPFEEMCLSFPGCKADTERYVWAAFNTLNQGKLTFGPTQPEQWNSTNLLLSVVAQHEWEHLFGILFFDRRQAKPAVERSET